MQDKAALPNTSGMVIILNGASSAGKTSLLRAVQAVMPRPFLDAGLDRFIGMMPERYVEMPTWREMFGQMDRAGPLGNKLVKSMHRAVASLAVTGWNVVADHVFIEREWVYDLATSMTGLRAWLIGVHCPLDLLADRERERGDRLIGQAGLHCQLAHRHARYDLEVDTSTAQPEALAMRIKKLVESDVEPAALSQLAAHAVDWNCP